MILSSFRDLDQTLRVVSVDNDYCGSRAYIVSAPDREAALVIDPGDINSGRVSAHLAALGCTKVLVALTHEHFDHMSGVNRLRKCFNTTVITSEICSQSIVDPKRNLSRYSVGVDFRCDSAELLCEGERSELDWNGIRIEFLSTPGHSPGSICITVDGCLFSGDTLIFGVPTVVKLPGGSRFDLQKTITRLLTRFRADTMVYPGHGEIFRLGQLDPALVLGARKVQARSR